MTFVHVLKFNPNHDARGRFAESGGGRRGGTYGTPTEDAFGRPLKLPNKKPQFSAPTMDSFGRPIKGKKNPWNAPEEGKAARSPRTASGQFHVLDINRTNAMNSLSNESAYHVVTPRTRY